VPDHQPARARRGLDPGNQPAGLADRHPDTAIQHNRAEIAAVRDSGARMVALSGPEAGTTWAQLEIVMCQWRRIEALLADPGPFVYTATRSSLRRVPLA
jgi:hypothetical protein